MPGRYLVNEAEPRILGWYLRSRGFSRLPAL